MRISRIATVFAVAAASLAIVSVAAPVARAEEATLMEYSVDIVSDYVFRGIDVYEGVYDANGNDRGSFQFAPAIQPSFTFPGPGGFSANLWGSFALTNRSEDDADLAALDELDMTFSYAWENPLGSFDAGYIVYTLVNPRGGGNIDEIYFSWGLPILAAVSPTIAHYAVASGDGQYTALSLGGGDALSWSFNVGTAKTGIQDITAGLSYAIGAFSVSANVANRPKLALHDFDGEPDGKYTNPDGELKDLPSNIFWIGFSYGGSVTE